MCTIRWACYGPAMLFFIGLRKELDKIERTVVKVVKHPKMTKPATAELQRDVKVGRIVRGSLMVEANS